MVSVVIPAYNSAKTICRAVDSALLQQVPLEILVIDDASSDETELVMRKYANEKRVRYLKNEENLGVSASRNRGVAAASGEYIAFLDADDYWAADKLEKQQRLMESTGEVLCCTGRELVDEKGAPSGKVIPVNEKITYQQLLLGNVINCSSVLAKKSVLLEFPMEKDECHEDYLCWLRILRKYRTACGIAEPLLKYYVSSSGKSGNKFHSAGMTYQVYRHLGIGRVRAVGYFFCYAWNGLKKYAKAYRKA
ncbi:MAG: glycosyltransferase family 2 protein [Lachnospiraceae bacterium]|nr:glycosyltransferase family 2 protein [Lachnospiraceae bacterium]